MNHNLPTAAGGHVAAFRYAQEHRDSIRRIISSRLGARLRQVFSASDIEQSLLRCLLERTGPREPLADHELARLVNVIAVRLVLAKARHEHFSRRLPLPERESETTPADDPAEHAAARDFLAVVRSAVGEEDWLLVEGRLQGKTFLELCDAFPGLTDDALRMRFHRALDRITQQFGGLGDV